VIALLLLSALPLGPCADAAACTMRVRAPDELLAVGRAAVSAAGLKEADAKVEPLKPKVLKGDVAFGLELERDGEQIIVRALSLHRPPSTYGLARVTPQRVPKPAQQARALQLAVTDGLRRAMADLAEQLLEAAGQGQRKLKLSVQVTGLGVQARRDVAEMLMPCLKRQLDALGAITEPVEVQGYLEDEVLYAPAPDEPRESLSWQTERMRDAVMGPKPACPVAGTSIERGKLRFTADTLNHAVVVTMAR
jgi:hypothetical protein